MMRTRKPREGEIVLDLGKHLSAGQQFWRPDDVDEIVTMLQGDVASKVVRSVSHEVGVKSYPKNYQVLHVALVVGAASKGTFYAYAAAIILMVRTKCNARQRRADENRAAS